MPSLSRLWEGSWGLASEGRPCPPQQGPGLPMSRDICCRGPCTAPGLGSRPVTEELSQASPCPSPPWGPRVPG